MAKVIPRLAYRGHLSDGQDRSHVDLLRRSWWWLMLILGGVHGEVSAMVEVTPELGLWGGLNDGRGRSFADHGPLLQKALGDGKVPSQETLSHAYPLFLKQNLNLVSLILKGECQVSGNFSCVSNIHFLKVLHCHYFEQDGFYYVGW
jgi:hypothetical protein